MIEIFDDFLNPNDFEKVNKTLTSESKLAWYYKNSVIYSNHNHETHYQFVHNFYDNLTWLSSLGEVLLPCVKQLKAVALIRIKANLLIKTENHVEHGFHTDFVCKSPHKTAILYVNTNNGYTLFEDGTKVKSEANRMIVFDGSLRHTGATCTDEKTRIVVNFNFFV